ncbi:uncharacterized protein ASPGLDRAFT_1030742 [Aspergillus glaucus CBS 516.65]|uniref:Secreted protein n=1 Tax=Aspergillus glaucus CBS 516.65 TaxID=1160497 RepID=A0A1L9VW45_ASPGL|nr:hypothetical protein ASPGLDRAFT_1030742 [Aspergillus glaucus CBS 516.65]OJJ88130.1 hypothetical protein ASPGLDRAFT_1030742 [Aspergillus glaucus CBS 516.65]
MYRVIQVYLCFLVGSLLHHMISRSPCQYHNRASTVTHNPANNNALNTHLSHTHIHTYTHAHSARYAPQHSQELTHNRQARSLCVMFAVAAL